MAAEAVLAAARVAARRTEYLNMMTKKDTVGEVVVMKETGTTDRLARM